MAELFWRITQEARVGLMQYQEKHHRIKLDIVSEVPSWLREKLPWKIPVSIDMTEKELDKFMRRKPKHPAGRGYKP